MKPHKPQAMKRIVFLLLLTASLAIAKAQSSSLVFFTENGERFSVILNGMLQNEYPETNIMITDLPAPSYKVKILFSEKRLGEINKTVYTQYGFETTYAIRKGKKGYAIRLMNSYPLDQAPMPATGDMVIGYRPEGVAPGSAVSTTVINNTTINNNVNVSATGVGNTVNVSNSNEGAGQLGLQGNTGIQQAGDPLGGYVLPGYSGPYGCPRPMARPDFEEAKNTIRTKTFEDSKLTIAKQIISSNCLLSGQVKEILMLFTYESTKLDFAKFAYRYTLDQGNYFKINDVFTFESSIDELDQYIHGR